MQEQPAQPVAAQLGIEGGVAVAIVTGQRMAGVRGVHPDLVRAPRLQHRFHQRGRGVAGTDVEPGGRRSAGRRHGGGALAATPSGGVQGHIDPLQRVRPVPPHEQHVALVPCAGPQARLQCGETGPVLGADQYAAGGLVQPMHEFQRCGVHGAQRLDHPPVATGAGVHRHSGRLVQCQQVRILVQHPPEQSLARLPRRRLPARRRGAHRRHPHQITGLQAIGRLHATLVHAHLALAQDTVDMGARYALELAEQVVVDPLSGLLGLDAL